MPEYQPSYIAALTIGLIIGIIMSIGGFMEVKQCNAKGGERLRSFAGAWKCYDAKSLHEIKDTTP